MRLPFRPLTYFWMIAALAWAGVLFMQGQAPQPDGAGVERGRLPVRWTSGGPRCMEQPDWQVHEYNQDFYILRESGCVHYEKPFLYLIFGQDKVVLMDTGAGTTELASTVDGIIAKWLQRKKRSSIKFMVMHSHGHRDHVARDSQFNNKAAVEFVPAEIPAVQKAFGIKQWPIDIGALELGGRTLDVIPIPGHHPVAVALYDRRTAVLMTGDNVYPGRLYIGEWRAFVDSTKRLADFTRSRLVSHVLGCHIEQTDTPFLEFPIGSIFQPSEHVLELSRGDLIELNQVMQENKTEPKRIALRSMTIYPTNEAVWQELRKVREQTETKQRETQFAQPLSTGTAPR
ncbi:MAG: MBL fold metallo-hydrolase [Acidobacteria bacterium]|nr:MBL fold metallo-hydrolase [Acidobacteriota bacterium]